jgi:YYY domain-containing protein
MLEILKWYLVLQLLGLIGLPITQRLFSALPSRGYACAKPLTLLLCGYVFWLLGMFGFLANTTGAVVLVLGVIAIGAAYLAWRDREPLRVWWRQQRAFVVMTELVFSVFCALWIIYRLYNPDLTSTEKPMDFMFLNSSLRSPTMPPRDPWLSGFAISYYYFGYLLNSILIRLADVSAGVGFSLALTTIMGLVATGAYAIAYDLIVLRMANGEWRMANRESQIAISNYQLPITTYFFPLLAAVFLVISSNLEGALELLNANGIGSPAWYAFFNVRNFPPTYVSPTGLPTDNWWWWRASRVLSDPNLEIISEFPYFSFIIADLHPHVMALPFVLIALALALQTLIYTPSATFNAQSASVVRGFEVQNQAAEPPLSTLQWLYPIILGALGFLNSWDFPTYTGLVILAYAINRYRTQGLSAAFGFDVIQFALTMGGFSILLYVPFYLTFSSQASGIRFWLGKRTAFPHLLLFWGFFLFIVVSFIVNHWRTLNDQVTQHRAWWIYLVVWFGLIGGMAIFSWPSAMCIALLLALLGVLLIHHAKQSAERSAEVEAFSSAMTFTTLLLVVGFALMLIVEFFFIGDTFGTRMNTVFKFYYQAWTLVAIASAYLVYQLINPNSPIANRQSQSAIRNPQFAIRVTWLLFFVLLFSATLLYPIAAFATQTNGLQNEPFLDGMENLQRYRSGDHAAIAWLQANAPLDAVIVEAVGGDYSEYGRVAARTGIPSVLNWGGHQLQWRGNGDEAARREPDVRDIYTSLDAKRVGELLRKYNVTYIVVGGLERDKYGAAFPFTRFTNLVEKVFDEKGTAIWRVK